MKFTPSNFLQFVKELVTGGGRDASSKILADSGYLHDTVLDLGDFTALGTNESYTTTGGVPVLAGTAAGASATTIGTISIPIPRDYDEATDDAQIRILAATAGTTDSPTITVTPSVILPGSSTVSAKTAVTSAAVNGATIQTLNLDIGQNGLVRDAILSLAFTNAAHTTDALYIYGVELVYRSTLVSYNVTDGSNDQTGTQLR